MAMERSEFSGDTAVEGLTRLGTLDAHPRQDVPSLEPYSGGATGLYHRY